MRFLMRLLRLLCWLVLLIAAVWAFGALWFDFPVRPLRPVIAAGFAIAFFVVLLMVRPRWLGRGIVVMLILIIAMAWSMLKPSNIRDWQPNVALAPWAEVDGDLVTIHNVRNCEYRN